MCTMKPAFRKKSGPMAKGLPVPAKGPTRGAASHGPSKPASLPVLRELLAFALPFFLACLLQTLYGLADLYIIGRYDGVAATTAVSVGSQVMHMLTVVLTGLAMGVTVKIGHAVGAGDRTAANRTAGNAGTLFLGLSLLLTAGLLLGVRGVVRLMSTPAAAASDTAAYLTICFAGLPFITAYNVLSAILRGMGDSKSPLCFVAIACAVNIGLDCLLIGGLGLGAAGAALGTTLAQGVSVAAALVIIRHKRLLPGLRRADFAPRRQVLAPMLRVGGPVAVQDGFIQIAFLAVTVFANRRGLADAAAVGVVEKVIGILFLAPSAMLSAVSALCALHIGAGDTARVHATLRYALAVTAGFGLLTACGLQFCAEQLVGWFRPDAEVVRLGGQYLRSYAWDCLFAGIHFCFSGWFCAWGLSGIPFLHNAVSIVCARVPLAWWASRHFADTLYPMGLAAPAGSLLSVLICLVAYGWLCRHPARLAAAAKPDAR